jgi:hypothetical protein
VIPSDSKIFFRINSQISFDWSGENVIISIPKLPTEPPFITENNSYDTYSHKNDSLAYALLQFLGSPRSFNEIREKGFNTTEKELELTFSDMERKRIIVPGFSLREHKQYKSTAARSFLAEKVKRKKLPLSPVFLVGGGNSQATIGLSYLASYLNQNDVVAKVWANREDEVYLELREHITNLFSRVSYALVGISFKWFHHVSSSLMLGAVINELYPDVIIVYGGNSATLFRHELLQFEFVDCVILGDGEQPLLQLCQGDKEVPNCAFMEEDLLKETLQSYSQRGLPSEDIRLSVLEHIYLSKKDLIEANALIVGGKGCDDNCLYCGGSQPNQIKLFQREHSFLRPVEDVKNDVMQILPYNAGLFMDFTSWNVDLEVYLRSVFSEMDLSQRSLTLLSWSIPSASLLEFLSTRFCIVYALIDVGCLSEKQRIYLWQHGYYKHAATNKDILAFFDDCEKYSTIFYGLFSIFGLPFATVEDLKAEREFVEQLEERSAYLPESNLLLEVQPGSMVTENAQMFNMDVETKTFWEYLKYFEETGQVGRSSLRVKFQDMAMDARIVESAKELHAKISKLSPMQYDLARLSREQLLETSLIQEKHLRFAIPESEWHGDHKICSMKNHATVIIFKNFRNYYIHFNKSNLPFLKSNNDADAYAIADEMIDLFKKPLTVAEAFQSTKIRHDISEEQFLEFIRLAAKRYLLKIAQK